MNLRKALIIPTAVIMLASLCTTTSAHPPHLFSAEAYPATIKANPETAQVITTGVGVLSCKEALFEGTLNAAAEELETTPAYATCTFLGFPNIPVKMNGCTYRFRPLLEPAAGLHEGTMKIICPAGKEIEFEAAGCKIAILPQLREVVSFTNEGAAKNRSVKLGIKLKALEYTTNAGCPGGAAKFANGKYEGTLKAEAFVANEQRGLWIE